MLFDGHLSLLRTIKRGIGQAPMLLGSGKRKEAALAEDPAASDAQNAAKRPKTTATTTVSAIQDAINTLTNLDLPPHAFNSMLEALTTTHVSALKDTQVQKQQVKEREKDEPPQVAPASILTQMKGVTEVAKIVVRDFEEGKPWFDKLGIIVRPVAGEDQKMDWMTWEVKLPESSCFSDGALYPFLVTFHPEYPVKIPKSLARRYQTRASDSFLSFSDLVCSPLKSDFFHINAGPSGTLYRGHGLDDGLGWDRKKFKHSLGLGSLWGCNGEDIALHELQGYRYEQPALRLPKLFASAQYILGNPDPDEFSNLEAHTLFRKDNAEYRSRVTLQSRQFAPTAKDILYRQMIYATSHL